MARLLVATEVAALLRVNTDYIYKLAREGKIPCLQFGRSYRFREDSIVRWLEEEEINRRAGESARKEQHT